MSDLTQKAADIISPRALLRKTLLVSLSLSLVLITSLASGCIKTNNTGDNGNSSNTNNSNNSSNSSNWGNNTNSNNSNNSNSNTNNSNTNSNSNNNGSTLLDGSPYSHAGLGINFTLPTGWTAHESTAYPDEVLTILPDDSANENVIWIDRYPGYTVADALNNQAEWFGPYTLSDASTATINNDMDNTPMTYNGINWTVLSFTTTAQGQTTFVILSLADMPNDRGIFMLALMIPVRSDMSTEQLASVEYETILSTLQFSTTTASSSGLTY